MNDSIMKNEPTTNASNSVENTEGKIISLKAKSEKSDDAKLKGPFNGQPVAE